MSTVICTDFGRNNNLETELKAAGTKFLAAIFMTANKIVKSLIPQAIREGIPSEKQAHVAAKIVKFFRESTPDLYERLEASESLTDELTAECAAAIDEAVRKAREHHLEMVKLHGGK